MIVEHEARLAALMVDELLGQQQVVIKSLEANFQKVEGIAGATILGDGRVARSSSTCPRLVTLARGAAGGSRGAGRGPGGMRSGSAIDAGPGSSVAT